MNKLINEDWERNHLTDEIYLKEVEYEELQYLQEERNKRLPAIIKIVIPQFKPLKNEIRHN